MNINVIKATQIDDNNVKAPLLPPDEITHNDKLHKMTCVNDARSWYNTLKKYDHESKYKKRKYVKGSFHNSCFGNQYYNTIDWNILGDTNIIVSLNDTETTVIKIRKANKVLIKSMKDLSLRLSKEKANSRGSRCGDLGKMFSLGEKGNDEFSLSKKTKTFK